MTVFTLPRAAAVLLHLAAAPVSGIDIGKLRGLWPGLSSADRAVCVGDAELGVARSYADLLGCIETSRELRREDEPKAGSAPRRGRRAARLRPASLACGTRPVIDSRPPPHARGGAGPNRPQH